MTKQVHTSIDDETWKIVQLNDLRWTECIRTGAQVLSGLSNEKQKIIDKIARLEIEIEVLRKKSKDMDEKEKEESKKNKERVYAEFKLPIQGSSR